MTNRNDRNVHAGSADRSPSTHIREIALRFCLVYFALYSLVTQILGGLLILPRAVFPALGTRWPMRDITAWMADHVFHFTDVNYAGNSGDTAFHWVQTFVVLVVAAVVTALWWAFDRRRLRDAAHVWFRVFIRFALAAQMFYYGMAKVIPTQFPAPSLVTLVEPVGDLSLTGILWTSTGASWAYQAFTGWAEVIAGALLVVPHTAVAGAIICFADMLQVFVLNMTFDIGLKLISFHLLMMTVYLLAPELRGMTGYVLSAGRRLFAYPVGTRAFAAQVILGAYLLGTFTSVSWARWYADGGGSATSPLYGIWEVEELAVNGTSRPPSLNDYDRRWRRVIFDKPGRMVVQRTDDSFARFGVSIDTANHTLELTKGNSRTWRAVFSYFPQANDLLTLEGEMDGHRVQAQLELVPLDTFRLLNSSFRWIRPADLIAD